MVIKTLVILIASLHVVISESDNEDIPVTILPIEPPPRKIVCQKEHEKCEYGCYDPSIHICLEGKICNKGEKSCGNKCFNPAEEDCVATGMGYDAVCPKGQLRCPKAWNCYDPSTEACTSDGKVCPIGQDSCGYNCYKPGDKQCLNEQVCEIGETVCGSECYTPSSEKECVDNDLCEPGQKSCGWRGCYNPAESTCYEDGNVLCKKEEKKCGYECYDSNTEKCFNDHKVCRSTREPCGDYDCYWAKNETCYTGRRGYSASSCPNDRKACGYDCYEEGKAVCLNYNDYFEMLCKVGEEVCGSRCFNKESGKKCFKGYILCHSDEEVCGRQCYNPNLLPAMTCHDDTALCGDDERPCGERCFNPETEKCVEVKGSFGRWL